MYGYIIWRFQWFWQWWLENINWIWRHFWIPVNSSGGESSSDWQQLVTSDLLFNKTSKEVEINTESNEMFCFQIVCVDFSLKIWIRQQHIAKAGELGVMWKNIFWSTIKKLEKQCLGWKLKRIGLECYLKEHYKLWVSSQTSDKALCLYLIHSHLKWLS